MFGRKGKSSMTRNSRWWVWAGVAGALAAGMVARAVGGPAAGDPTPGSNQSIRLAIVLSQSDPETAFNAFRVAEYSLEAGDDVSVFLLGKGVDLDKIQDATYDVREKAQAFQAAGGKILACGTCLQMHGSSGSKLCPVSTMKDLYELVRGADRVLTF